MSLNQWIAAAVAEKVGMIETAAEFFKKRAGKATGAGMMKFLRNAPKTAPESEDVIRFIRLSNHPTQAKSELEWANGPTCSERA